LGMDLVLVGLLAVLPLLAWSVHLVKNRRAYAAHKRIQLFIAAALLAVIVLFEIDIRLVSDWRLRAHGSPWWPAGVVTALGVHLVFAVSTLVLWIWVLWEAVARFPVPPEPGSHGPRHRFMARLAAVDLVLTACTGCFFYWMAFVAR
jgi:putative membrane protein